LLALLTVGVVNTFAFWASVFRKPIPVKILFTTMDPDKSGCFVFGCALAIAAGQRNHYAFLFFFVAF